MKCLLTILLCGYSLAVSAQPEKAKAIDSLLRAAHAIGVFNGNALVAEGGKIIYQGAIGDADAGKSRPLSMDFRFQIGSISKEFNSVGIMVLQKRGLLSLEDSVSRFLTWLPPWAGKIKIKDLLQYTSGLPQSNAGTGAEYRTELQNLRQLAFEPGTAYIYSNDNIYLQQRIIETITGGTYDSFVKDVLLKAAGMRGAVIDSFPVVERVARPIDNDGVETPDMQKVNGLFVTAADLFKWAMALQTGSVISRTGVQELSANFGQNESSLGNVIWAGERIDWHVHQGSGYNYESLLYSSETNGATIILLTNNQEFKVQELKDAILNLLQGKPYTVPKKSVYLDLRTKVFDDFDKGLVFYEMIKSEEKDKYDLSNLPNDLYNTAKYLMRRSRYDDAIKILHLSTLEDLTNKGGMSYAFMLIGQCYQNKGEKKLSEVYYSKSVELDPTNKNAQGMLDEIRKENRPAN